MRAHRKTRLWWIISIVLATGIAAALVLYALKQNINLYLTPTQVANGLAPKNSAFRIGGMVKDHSFSRYGRTLMVHFVLTDYQHNVPVNYTGVLPALFREGQGIVVTGQFNARQQFIASEVLAKHDEKYMPPEVQTMLNKRKQALS